MKLTKQSEQYSLKDTFKGVEVTGSVTFGESISVNINCNLDGKYCNANYNKMTDNASINVNCPDECIVEFTTYLMSVVEDVNSNKESIA